MELEDWFFLPGDRLIDLLASRAPWLADALWIGPADHGGLLAGILAATCWLVLAIALISAAAAVRRFDVRVTDAIAYGVKELRRHVRMAIVRAQYRRSRRTQRKEPSLDLEVEP